MKWSEREYFILRLLAVSHERLTPEIVRFLLKESEGKLISDVDALLLKGVKKA